MSNNINPKHHFLILKNINLRDGKFESSCEYELDTTNHKATSFHLLGIL